VFNGGSAHSIVIEALEKNRACEALAKRIWMSFVVEGRESLFQDDIIEVLGENRREAAEECFACLDADGNGDISLDEMILTVTEIGRARKSIASSMHDVDQAIKVLDGLLSTIVFIIAVFVFVAFLNQSFTTTLATAGTALLSLSFVFAVTCQEGSLLNLPLT
jgi:small-conductance mechanosensitive channel